MSPRIRSAQQAVNAVLSDLQRAASCVTNAVLIPVRRKESGSRAPVAVTFGGDSGRAKLGTRLWVSVAMELEPAEDEEAQSAWRTHTMSYNFSVFGSESGKDERFCFHYHPLSGAARPHLHVNADAPWARAGLRKKHFATGRVSLEDFVGMLIEEFRASPQRDDWQDVLEDGRLAFAARRTW